MWECSLSHIYLHEGIRKGSKGQSLSCSISRAWKYTLVCSRSLSLNENNGLALGDSGPQHSWPLVLSFGFKVNLYKGLMWNSIPHTANIPIEINRCVCKVKYYSLWVRAIWCETTDLALKYVFIFLGEYVLTCGILVLACTCCVCRIVLQKK